jgi:hypothetical protein
VNHKFLEFALINYTVAVEKIKKADIKLIYSYKMTNGIVVMLSRVQFSLLIMLNKYLLGNLLTKS